MFINNLHFPTCKMVRVLILEAVVLSKLHSKIIGLFISLFLLWLRKTVKSDFFFFNAVMADLEFLFCTNHHLAKNSIFGQERLFSQLKCDWILPNWENTHSFCQSIGTTHQVKNHTWQSSQYFGHLFGVQEVKYLFSSITKNLRTLNVVPRSRLLSTNFFCNCIFIIIFKL